MSTASARAANPTPLADLARNYALPDGIAFTRYYELIAPQLPGMGITLDRWQQDVWEIALGLRADGTLCCDVMGVTLSIARQAGKTWGIMVGLIATCISRPNTTVVWSSHHDRTSSETLEKIAGIVEKPAIRPKMRARHPVVMTDDSRGVHFANGSRILFGARSSGFGRGFSEVDIQVYDECQNLREAALTDMMAAMNVSDIGLAFFMGTPPRPQDTRLGVDEAFRRRRTRAIEPVKRRPFKGLFVEFSAESGAPLSIDGKDFWDHIRRANPSFGYRVFESAIERLVENMADDDVAREVMGIWDDDAELLARVIMADEWAGTAVAFPPSSGVMSMGVKFSPDGSRVAVSGAVKPASGPIHVELIGAHSGSMTTGTASLVAWIASRASRYAVIVVDGKSNAGSFANDLIEAGVPKKQIVIPPWSDVATANSMLLSGLTGGAVTHLASDGQMVLDESVEKAEKKARPDGSWGFIAPSEPGAEVPIQSVALAHWGVKTTKRDPNRSQKVVVLSD